jgi:hypothetical protein
VGNHTGPLCDLCASGLVRIRSGDCEPCRDPKGLLLQLTIVGSVVVALLGLAAVLAVFAGLVGLPLDGADSDVEDDSDSTIDESRRGQSRSPMPQLPEWLLRVRRSRLAKRIRDGYRWLYWGVKRYVWLQKRYPTSLVPRRDSRLQDTPVSAGRHAHALKATKSVVFTPKPRVDGVTVNGGRDDRVGGVNGDGGPEEPVATASPALTSAAVVGTAVVGGSGGAAARTTTIIPRRPSHEGVTRKPKLVDIGLKLKVIITFFQLSSIVVRSDVLLLGVPIVLPLCRSALHLACLQMTEYRVTFPPAARRVARAFSAFNVSPFTFFRPSCRTQGFDAFSRLIVMTAVPMTVMAVLFSVSWFMRVQSSAAGHRRNTLLRKLNRAVTSSRKWELRLFQAALFVSYISLPPVAATIAKAFNCVSFDDGSSYLAVDFTIDCNSVRYRHMVAYASAMLAVFPIGIPCFYLWTLWRHRRTLYPRNAGRLVTLHRLEPLPSAEPSSIVMLLRSLFSKCSGSCRRCRVAQRTGTVSPASADAVDVLVRPSAAADDDSKASDRDAIVGVSTPQFYGGATPAPALRPHAVKVTMHLGDEHVRAFAVRGLVRSVAGALLRHRALVEWRGRLCVCRTRRPTWRRSSASASPSGSASAFRTSFRRWCRGVMPEEVATEMGSVLSTLRVQDAGAGGVISPMSTPTSPGSPASQSRALRPRSDSRSGVQASLSPVDLKRQRSNSRSGVDASLSPVDISGKRQRSNSRSTVRWQESPSPTGRPPLRKQFSSRRGGGRVQRPVQGTTACSSLVVHAHPALHRTCSHCIATGSFFCGAVTRLQYRSFVCVLCCVVSCCVVLCRVCVRVRAYVRFPAAVALLG